MKFHTEAIDTTVSNKVDLALGIGKFVSDDEVEVIEPKEKDPVFQTIQKGRKATRHHKFCQTLFKYYSIYIWSCWNLRANGTDMHPNPNSHTISQIDLL